MPEDVGLSGGTQLSQRMGNPHRFVEGTSLRLAGNFTCFCVLFMEKNACVLRCRPDTAMPCTVTAFSVKIASPGGAAIELIIAREVIGEWNARNALEQKRILLPLDAAHDPSEADLLIAFFCNSLDVPGIPGDPAPESAEEEIENQLRAGRPVLIYFSEARIDLRGAPVLPGGSLDEFKKRYMTATVDSYADDKEFRGKLARQLDPDGQRARHISRRVASLPSRLRRSSTLGAPGPCHPGPRPF